MNAHPLVSLIIPTYNSANTIENCLKSIKEQTYEKIEVIVVDDHSIDETRNIAEKYGARVLIKGPERNPQRNFGAQHARGDYLFFIDSDMELTRRVMEESVNKIKREKAHALIVPEISVGEGFWSKCKALEKLCYVGEDTIEAPRFFDKRVFFEAGGYDEDMIAAEDWDLLLRVRKADYKIARIDSVIKHNEGKLTLWRSVKKKYYYGKTIGRYLQKHPEVARRQLSPFRVMLFVKKRKILAHSPFHAAGLFFLKFMEFIAINMGTLVGQ